MIKWLHSHLWISEFAYSNYFIKHGDLVEDQLVHLIDESDNLTKTLDNLSPSNFKHQMSIGDSTRKTTNVPDWPPLLRQHKYLSSGLCSRLFRSNDWCAQNARRSSNLNWQSINGRFDCVSSRSYLCPISPCRTHNKLVSRCVATSSMTQQIKRET